MTFLRFQLKLEQEIHSYWSPHLGQAPIAKSLLRDWKRYVFLQCGRKFGKTDFAIYCMYMFAILFPNSQIYYIADTMKHAGELVWHSSRLQKFFLNPKRMIGESNEMLEHRRKVGIELHHKYVDKANNAEMRLKFKNGSFIKVDGAENYSNADGIEPDFMVYDEFKSHDYRFNEAMEPNLRVKKAPLLIVGTPPEELGTYYEKIANSFKRLKYGSHFQRPSYLNSHIYPGGEQDPEFVEECEKYTSRGDDDVKRRELYAEILVSGSKALFPNLELPEYDYVNEKYIGHSRHVKKHSDLIATIAKNPKDWEYYDTYDAGSAICFAVLFGVINKYTKQVIILDCIYETSTMETSTGRLYPRAEKIMKEIMDFEDNWTGTYDHAALWFATEVLDRYDRGLQPCTKDMKKKFAKLTMIKDMLWEDMLVFSDRCMDGLDEKRGVIWEMINYRKDENGRIPKKDDHAIDTLRYKLNAMMYDPKWLRKPDEEEEIDMRRGESLTDGSSRKDYYGAGKTNQKLLGSNLREKYEY